MTRASPAFANWTAGELSARLEGRTDLDKYFQGARSIENFIVHPHGGVSRRPGTAYVAPVKDSAAKTRLLPFEFNVTQTYIIEFGNLYLRFYKDGGVILEAAKTISAATKANPCVVTASSHGFLDGDEVEISGVVGMTEINGRRFTVANKTTNTFELSGINSTDFTTYGSAGTASRVYTVTTTYTTAQIPDLKFAQSADILYICHNSHEPIKLTRTGHTAWTLTAISFVNGPYLDQNTTTTTLIANGRSGSVTITASSGVFVSTDVGRLVKMYNGYAKISGYSSATSVTATVQTKDDGISEWLPTYTAATIGFTEGDPSTTGLPHNDRVTDGARLFEEEGFADGMDITITGSASNNKDVRAASVSDDTVILKPIDDLVAETSGASVTLVGKLTGVSKWSLGAFSATTGYPAAVSFYEERLVFANTTEQPQTLWFSRSGDYENFTTSATVQDDDALTYTIASNSVNSIRYLSAAKNLLVGTVGGEFIVRASGTDQPITPTNVQIKQQTRFGSANIQPQVVANVTLFLQRAKRKVREMRFDYDSDSYTAHDMTILADHVTASGVTEMAYQQEPDSILWAALADGTLAGLTYRREEGVVAWHRHKIGGSNTTAFNSASDVTASGSDGDGNGYVTITGHSFSTGDKFVYDSNSGTAMVGLTDGETYYIHKRDANKIEIAGTASAAAARRVIKIGLGVGVHLIVQDAAVESLATLPTDADEDELWMIVKRTIGANATATVTISNYANIAAGEKVTLIATAGTSYDFVEGSQTTSAGTFDAATSNNQTATNLAACINAGDGPSGTRFYATASSAVVTITQAVAGWNGQTVVTLTDAGSVGMTKTNFFSGSTVRRYVEKMTAVDFGTDVTSAFFVDSGLSYEGAAATALTGLHHLEGLAVQTLNNGSASSDKQVLSGSITLDAATVKCHTGLGYNSTLQTMRVEAGSADGGTSQGKIKRIHDLTVRLYNTVGMMIGKSTTDLDRVPFRDSSMAMDSPIPMFSGDKDIEFAEGLDQDGFIVIRQDQPLPMTIIAVYPRLQTFDP